MENEFEQESATEDMDIDQSVEPNAAIETESQTYDQDPRFETEWNRDPHAMYRSFLNVEKSLPTLQKEHGEYKQKVTDYESKLSTLEGEVGSLSQVKQLVEFFESNPAYQTALMENLEKVAAEQRRIKYGDLPPEMISKLERADAVDKKFQEMERAQELEKQTNVIHSELAGIDSISKKYGVEYDQREFLTYCKTNNIPPQHMGAIFSKFAMDAVVKNAQRQSSVNTAKTIQGNKARAIAPSQSRQPNAKPESYRDQIARMLTK